MIETGLDELDKGRLFLRGREHVQHCYAKVRFCENCNGRGSYWGTRPNRNVPGKAFARLKPCKPCKGKGYIEEWSPPTARFFCKNPLCRYVTEMDLRDIIKGRKGFVRSHSIDFINYTSNRECPHCHSPLRAQHRLRLWRWSTRLNRWVDYWARREVRIRRV